MNENTNMAQRYVHEIPEGYEAKIEDGKVIIELKESEDERIRKELEYFIQKEKEYMESKVKPENSPRLMFLMDALTYLEKQKEQKSAEWSYPYGRNETVDRLISLAECLEMDGDCLFNGYFGTECGKFLRELARKQIGCKPAEWSEEDEKMLERCVSKMANIIPVPGKHGLTNMSFEKHTDEKLAAWLKSLPERFNLQPKQVWSEEDEKMLDYAIDACDAASDCYSNSQSYIDAAKWLKSIRPQPKQEWSEEDENMLKTIFDSLNTYAKNAHPCLKSVVEDEIAWLKSLRPQPKQDVSPSLREKEIICLKRALDYLRKEHNRYGEKDFTNEIAVLEWLITHPILVSDTHWKPSEEQMIYLKEAINKFDFCDGEKVGLRALYNDLQKLIDSKN